MSWKDRIRAVAAAATTPITPAKAVGRLSAPVKEPDCPFCHRPMVGRKCWRKKCCIALCDCGRPTESAFIVVCRRCEIAEYKRKGELY